MIPPLLKKSLPVQSHKNRETSIEASYPEFYTEVINSNNNEKDNVIFKKK